MKNKFLMMAGTSLLTICALSCSEDKSSELYAIGMVCNASTECVTHYCNEEHYCAEAPTKLLENGATCSKSSDCLSDYCDSQSVCAEKPGAGNNTGENVLGKTCSEHADCGENYCVSSVCVTIDDVNRSECNSSDNPYCLGDYLVKCRVYSEMSYRNDVTDCAKGEQKCIVHNSVGVCADPCTAEDVGKEKTICDEDNKNWEGYIIGVEVHKCQQVNDTYYYVFDRYENCAYDEICMGDVCF